jgi:hypothetical protein
MPTTLRLLFLLMLGFFGLQPVDYGYDAPTALVSGTQNIVAASPERRAANAESAASAPLNFSREGAASDSQAETREFSDFVAGSSTVADLGAQAGDDGLTFYRGDQSGLTEFQSHAAQTGGQAYSQDVLASNDLNDLMSQHAADSSNPPSPFISVTTNPDVARTFAGANGSVYKLQLAPGRAIPNLFNPFDENEYLVPNYISPGEIQGTVK